jgi:hypothetical protein
VAGEDDVRQVVLGALQQYAQNPPAGIEALRPAVERDERGARGLMAWMLAQQGRLEEAVQALLPLVEDGAGVAYLPVYIGQQAVAQADPTLREQGARVLQRAVRDAGSWDPFTHVQQLMAQGEVDAALDLLDAAVHPSPPVAERKAWQELLEETRAQARAVSDAKAKVETDQGRAQADIEGAREEVLRARDDLVRLVEEVGGLAGQAGAAVQANEYGSRADRIETLANRLTVAAVVLGTLIALGAVVLAISAAGATDPLTAAAEKAPISIPLLALNIYIGGLARGFRQEAVQLRHIELQIRTANPFLGALDEERRKAILAILALRFFPGQAAVEAQAAAPGSSEEGRLEALIGGLPGGGRVIDREPAPEPSSAPRPA